MGLHIVNSLKEEEWRNFVESQPDGNIFHTPEMFQVFAQADGFLPELWAAVEDGQILALFIPVHVFLQNVLLRRLTTRTVVYGSILSSPGREGEKALQRLLQEYKRISGKKSLFTELRNISPLGNFLPIMLQEGFAYEEHLNYLIDLDRPADAIFKSIGKRTQKNIKNGLNKAQVVIEKITSKSDLAACYELLSVTYRSAHVPLAPYSMFEAAFDILEPRGLALFFIVKADGKAAATSIELLYKDVIYGWYGGMDRKFSSYVPNELLMWHILKWGAEHGYKRYDFGGAGKPNEKYGVRNFKAKFGGQLVCYGRNTWIPHPSIYAMSKAAYGLFRHFLL